MVDSFINFLVFCICLVFLSCSSVEKQAVEGSWSIDEIHYNQYDVKMCMLVNIIEFNKNVCILPDINNCNDIFVNDRQSAWRLIKSDSDPILMEINSRNEVFNGVYKVLFEEDDDLKLFRMVLWSEDTFISMRKGLFDYDNEIEKYRGVIDKSQSVLK